MKLKNLQKDFIIGLVGIRGSDIPSVPVRVPMIKISRVHSFITPLRIPTSKSTYCLTHIFDLSNVSFLGSWRGKRARDAGRHHKLQVAEGAESYWLYDEVS